MTAIHLGKKVLSKKFENYCISNRKQYYCDSTGEVVGKDADCADSQSNRKDFPLFFTHQEWIDSLRDRTRSAGDCGYKLGILMEDTEELNPNLETVWAMFMKLDQDGSPEDRYETEKVYEGDFIFVGDDENQGFRNSN